VRPVSEPESSRDFIYEMPLSGVPRKIWDQTTWSGLWDWAPDDSTLLIWTDFDNPSVEELDLKSLSKSTFLSEPEYKLYQSHFSGHGRWVTFNAVKDLHSRIYVAPFAKLASPARNGFQSQTAPQMRSPTSLTTTS
jgi:hypothetical protein